MEQHLQINRATFDPCSGEPFREPVALFTLIVIVHAACHVQCVHFLSLLGWSMKGLIVPRLLFPLLPLFTNFGGY